MHVFSGATLRENRPPTEDRDLDPALLAFIKWHVTSPLKWEALWYMADREGRWLEAEEIARLLHAPRAHVEQALAELADEGVLDEAGADRTVAPSYRLPAHEPSTVVLHRLIESATRHQEVRNVVAAQLTAHRKD